MLKRILSMALLATLMSYGSGLDLTKAQSQNDKSIAEVRSEVAKRSAGKKRVTVELQSGRKLRGHVEHVGSSSFALKNVRQV